MNNFLTIIFLFSGLIRKWLISIFNKENIKYPTVRLYMMPLMQILICLFSFTGAMNFQNEISEEEAKIRNIMSNEIVSGIAEFVGYDTSTNDDAVSEALSEYTNAATTLMVIAIVAFIIQIYITNNRKKPFQLALLASATVITFDYYTAGVGSDFAQIYIQNQQLIKFMEFLGGTSGTSSKFTLVAYINPIILTICFIFYYKYLSEYYAAEELEINKKIGVSSAKERTYVPMPEVKTQQPEVKPIARPDVKPVAPQAKVETEETKRCPYCGEKILAVAKKCKYCGEWLDGSHKSYSKPVVVLNEDTEASSRPPEDNKSEVDVEIKESAKADTTDTNLEVPASSTEGEEDEVEPIVSPKETKDTVVTQPTTKQSLHVVPGDSTTSNNSSPISNNGEKQDGTKKFLGCFGIMVIIGGILVLCSILFRNNDKETMPDNKATEQTAPSEADISYSTNSIQPASSIQSASTLEVESETQELEPETDREDKLSETILNIASDGSTVIATSVEKVYYLIDSSSENVYDSDGANCGKICIYDVNDGTTTYERIHIQSGEPYNIESFNFADDKITFVLVDVGRNGFGTGNYITNVSQFNIKTGKWKTIAEGCADAEFTADKNYVIITTAVIANYDEVESAYEYQYEYSTSKIKL